MFSLRTVTPTCRCSLWTVFILSAHVPHACHHVPTSQEPGGKWHLLLLDKSLAFDFACNTEPNRARAICGGQDQYPRRLRDVSQCLSKPGSPSPSANAGLTSPANETRLKSTMFLSGAESIRPSPSPRFFCLMQKSVSQWVPRRPLFIDQTVYMGSWVLLKNRS